MPIRVLSEGLASRIAAGEVIERPASVVKELVENSLDAGATRVEVRVRDGGAKEVTVSDNGCGIAPGEIELAFERFATSKIDESSDLTGIRTLGFRGEALPSIASVAHVEAVSRAAGSDEAVRLELDYGRVKRRVAAGAPQGTTVRVEGLFKNVPARLKFMGSPGAELGRVHQLLNHLALVNPGVAFKLISDDEVRLASPGNGDRLAALAAVYGGKVAAAMLTIEGDNASAFSVSGLVSGLDLSRGNRSYITVAVNGRWVQNRRLSFALEQAYTGFLPERRFPVAVLDIRAPTDDVDVNVHPAKSEVRFLREDLVYSTIQRAVRGALTETGTVRAMQLPRQPTASTPARSGNGDSFGAAAYTGPAQRSFAVGATWPSLPAQPGATPQPDIKQEASKGPEHSPVAAAALGKPASPQKQVLPVLRVIGQAHATYIFAEGPDGVYMIDQHAAHERVIYEEIKAKVAAHAAESQPLMEPEAVELAPAQARAVEEQGAALSAAGFLVEPFGPRTVLLRAVPRLLASPGRDGRLGEWLVKLLDETSERAHAGAWQESLLNTMACHAAVRAGQKLSIEECRELIARLEMAEQPHTCPHGRPTLMHLPSGHLDRQFGRR